MNQYNALKLELDTLLRSLRDEVKTPTVVLLSVIAKILLAILARPSKTSSFRWVYHTFTPTVDVVDTKIFSTEQNEIVIPTITVPSPGSPIVCTYNNGRFVIPAGTSVVLPFVDSSTEVFARVQGIVPMTISCYFISICSPYMQDVKNDAVAFAGQFLNAIGRQNTLMTLSP